MENKKLEIIRTRKKEILKDQNKVKQSKHFSSIFSSEEKIEEKCFDPDKSETYKNKFLR